MKQSNFTRTTKVRPLIVRIAEKIDRVPGGCWLWTGALNKNPNGYPVIGAGNGSKRLIYVHRYMYALFTGTIPVGYEVDHTCQVTRCVKPTHLQAVTARRNKSLVGERITHCKRNHEFTPENTYYVKKKGNGVRKCRKCHADQQRRYRTQGMVA